MPLIDVAKWHARMSAIYALGVWTAIGTTGYIYYKARYESNLEGAVEETENPNQVVYETPYTTTIITYRKDFVPWRIRISKFIESFSNEK